MMNIATFIITAVAIFIQCIALITAAVVGALSVGAVVLIIASNIIEEHPSFQ